MKPHRCFARSLADGWPRMASLFRRRRCAQATRSMIVVTGSDPIDDGGGAACQRQAAALCLHRRARRLRHLHRQSRNRHALGRRTRSASSSAPSPRLPPSVSRARRASLMRSADAGESAPLRNHRGRARSSCRTMRRSRPLQHPAGLQVRRPAQATRFRTVRARAEKFISEIQLTGRVEVVTGDCAIHRRHRSEKASRGPAAQDRGRHPLAAVHFQPARRQARRPSRSPALRAREDPAESARWSWKCTFPTRSSLGTPPALARCIVTVSARWPRRQAVLIVDSRAGGIEGHHMKRALAAARSPSRPSPCLRHTRQQIVAQSNFVNRNQGAIPQISITVRADFVLFSVRYETATRSADAREDELAKTFAAVTQRASRAEGMSIEVGQPGVSAAIETAAIKELIQDRGDDRSGIDIVLKVHGASRTRRSTPSAPAPKSSSTTRRSPAASRRSSATTSSSASPSPRSTATR